MAKGKATAGKTEGLTVQRAQEDARRGRVEAGIAVLMPAAKAGDASAAFSLGCVLAFQGDWSGALRCAGQLLAHPLHVHAGNVFDEAFDLVTHAGRNTGDWSTVRSIAAQALQAVESKVETPHLRKRFVLYLEFLQDYAQRGGDPPHRPVFLTPSTTTPEESRRDYEAAKESALNLRPDLREGTVALALHEFSLARVYGQEDEIFRLYPPLSELLTFEDALEVASMLVRQGSHDAAWRVVEARLGAWQPMDEAQVAPVQLLTDPVLCELMTAERCAAVLSTPKP